MLAASWARVSAGCLRSPPQSLLLSQAHLHFLSWLWPGFKEEDKEIRRPPDAKNWKGSPWPLLRAAHQEWQARQSPG